MLLSPPQLQVHISWLQYLTEMATSGQHRRIPLETQV